MCIEIDTNNNIISYGSITRKTDMDFVTKCVVLVGTLSTRQFLA